MKNTPSSGNYLSGRKLFPGLLFIFVIGYSCVESFDIVTFFPSAEFEEQESTMVCWNPKFQNVIIPLVTEISKEDHVTLFYNEKYHDVKRIKNLLLSSSASIKNIDIHPFTLEKDNIWIRDYGPSFIQNDEGNMAVVGFEYPHLEYLDYKNFASSFSQKMKIPFYKSKLFSTGGGREINGRGTIILIEGYEKQINPRLTKEEIEQEYRQKFNQTNFIWLKRGIPQDDFLVFGPVTEDIYGFGVNWHIDEFCRFADANTILLAEIDSSDLKRDQFYQIIHDRLEENFQLLKKARDQDGNPFTIIRVPQAPVIFANGKLKEKPILYTPVTSYLNFVITNHSVIIPQYHVEDSPEWAKEKDEKAKEAFQKAFPTREVKFIDAIDLNYKGGGLHCITIHKPKKRKKMPVSLLRRRTLG